MSNEFKDKIDQYLLDAGKKAVVGFFLSLVACCGFTAPVIFDTPDATVIIVRPIDQWGGNKNYLEGSVSALQKKCFAVIRKNENIDKSLEEKLVAESNELGFERCYTGANMAAYIIPSPAVTLQPSEMDSFNKVQNYLYRGSIILQGDPSTLQDRISTKQSVGNVMELLTFAIATKVGLSNGAGVVGSLNIGAITANGVDQYPLNSEFRVKNDAIPILSSVPMDYSKFIGVDVRKIESWPSKNANGEIIIGYKRDKTPELESELLSKALIFAGGLKESVTDIDAARKDDYESRIKIWNACVAKGECKDEANP